MRPAGPIPRATLLQSDGATATVIAGAEYAAGGFKRVLAGSHYRDLWTAPVSVPVLDLTAFAGGLTPLRRAGGQQTATLRLQARDGRQFVFRTVAKDQRNVLAPHRRATLAADILQDQACALHPAGALVVDELAGALGVHRLHPQLVLAPEDGRLGAFEETFAGRLGIIEEFPVAGAGQGETARAEAIVSTRKLLKALARERGGRVDTQAYLRARLLDLLVGDWDRHGGQWRWAKRRERGRDVYHPLPHDRDQAFVRLDGVIPSLVKAASRRMESFSGEFLHIPHLMRMGRDLDARLLADLDWPDWERVAADAAARLTDAVIDAAVRRLPPPYYERSGEWLAAALKSRRDRLVQAARHFQATLVDGTDDFGGERPGRAASPPGGE